MHFVNLTREGMSVPIYLYVLHDPSYLYRTHTENVRKCAGNVIHAGYITDIVWLEDIPHLFCVQEMYLTHQISCVQ